MCKRTEGFFFLTWWLIIWGALLELIYSKTIEKITVNNLKIVQAPQKGELTIYKPSENEKTIFENKDEYEFDKINDKQEVKKILNLYMEKYYDENDDQQTWFGKIKDLAEEVGYAREVKEYKQNPEK